MVSDRESDWDERKVQAKRLTLLREDATTAPNACGVLVIDETGDRKNGRHPGLCRASIPGESGQD